jgi:hypothetical protein
LGRGSRDINMRCTGTLITSTPLISHISMWFKAFRMNDIQKASNMDILSRVARILHGKVLNND